MLEFPTDLAATLAEIDARVVQVKARRGQTPQVLVSPRRLALART